MNTIDLSFGFLKNTLTITGDIVAPGISLMPITPEIAIESSRLPGKFMVTRQTASSLQTPETSIVFLK